MKAIEKVEIIPMEFYIPLELAEEINKSIKKRKNEGLALVKIEKDIDKNAYDEDYRHGVVWLTFVKEDE